MNRSPSSPRRALLAALAAALSACSALALSSEPGVVLFQDDFSRPSSGWDRYRDSTYAADYHEGGYLVEIYLPNIDAWSTPRIDLGDVHIQVDARRYAGPDDNLYGVLCRYQDAHNYVFLVISSDGYAGVGVRRAGETQLLSGDVLLPHPAVQPGPAVNRLGAECVGDRFSLYVNGELAASGQDPAWPRGDVGLLAGAYETPGVAVLFDNLSVMQP